jgi:GNAT superfamily N-acetyltransferase
LRSESLATFQYAAPPGGELANGENRFNAPGEKLLGALSTGSWWRLRAECDPSARSRGPGAFAILHQRRLRRQGIGQQLLVSVITHSGTWFDFLNTHAPPSAWPFYESLGFARFMMNRGSRIACSVRFKRRWLVKRRVLQS